MDRGGVAEWADRCFAGNFSGSCLSFGYSREERENSFGWDGMKARQTDRLRKSPPLISGGKLEAEIFGDTGRLYRRIYLQTSAFAIVKLKPCAALKLQKAF